MQIRIWRLEVDAWGYLMVKRQRNFYQRGKATGGFEMANVRLYRSNVEWILVSFLTLEGGPDGGRFDAVAGYGARSVSYSVSLDRPSSHTRMANFTYPPRKMFR